MFLVHVLLQHCAHSVRGPCSIILKVTSLAAVTVLLINPPVRSEAIPCRAVNRPSRLFLVCIGLLVFCSLLQLLLLLLL